VSHEPEGPGLERRREPRFPARGPVRLRPEGLMSTAIKGRLLDLARSGFRARHACHTLFSGQVVEFRHARAQGRARVVWTRIIGDQIESGFFILPADTA